jgi:hypothetical protein
LLITITHFSDMLITGGHNSTLVQMTESHHQIVLPQSPQRHLA